MVVDDSVAENGSADAWVLSENSENAQLQPKWHLVISGTKLMTEMGQCMV